MAEQQLRAAQNANDELWVSSWKESDGEKTIALRSKVSSNIKLYGSWFCPYAQRVWIALEEIGVNYQYIEINPYYVDRTEPGGYTKKQLPMDIKKKLYPSFIETSPRGLVPALNNNGDLLYESLPILEYLNQTFNNNGKIELLPNDDAYKCAKVRIWCDYIGSKIQKNFYLMLMDQNQENQIKARNNFFIECRKLAKAMDKNGPFFLGKQFSIFDIALAPFWLRFNWIGSFYRDLKFPHNDEDFERLKIWWNNVKNRKSVKNTIVCKQRLISSYKQYSKNQGTSDYAKSISKDIKGKRNNDKNKKAFLSGAVFFVAGLVTAILVNSAYNRRTL